MKGLTAGLIPVFCKRGRDERRVLVTEAEWLGCTDPDSMLEFLRGRASERKLRLFACACCRRIWHLMPEERSRRAVETGERYADGLAGASELASAREEAQEALHQSPRWREPDTDADLEAA